MARHVFDMVEFITPLKKSAASDSDAMGFWTEVAIGANTMI